VGDGKSEIGSGAEIVAEHPLVQFARERVAPICELLEMKVEGVEKGRAVATLRAGPQHANPMGTLHGGVLCDLADLAMGIAFASTLTEGESFTTVELKINFFRPVWNGLLRAEGKVAHRGRTIGYVECDVTDEKGKVVAKANSTCLVLQGAKAEGR
jgi:uncharacterized protein (TIGR00369 family)